MTGHEPQHPGDPLSDPGLLPSSCRTVALRRGDVLFRQGDEGGSLYLVRSGRLRVLRETASGPQLLGEVFAGETVGEMALIAPAPRSATVVALRPCELVEVSPADFETMLRETPALGLGLLRLLVTRLRRIGETRRRRHPPDNLIVVSGASSADFGRLRSTLAAHGAVAVLSPGPPETFASTLARLEASHRFVLADLGAASGPWREALLGSADVVATWGPPTEGTAGQGLSLEEAVRRLVPAHVRPRFMAVLRHAGPPPYVGAETVLARWPVSEWHHVSEGDPGSFPRLCRVLANEEVTLVLAGGGARGLSHVGVLEVMAERGIPVDRVCGTSIGALVGALHASTRDPAVVAARLREHLVRRSRWINDYTLPVTSVIGAYHYTQAVKRMLGDGLIENLPADFFCVSCNLTQGVAVAHDTGPAWDWVATSMSLPGFSPPRLHQGELLADGGVTENLPTRLALRRSRGPVVAVDLSPSSDLRCDPGLSGRLYGFRAMFRKLPGIAQILCRASLIQADALRPAALAHADLVIAPEVGGFGLFDWRSMDAIVEAGRAAARRRFDESWPLPAHAPFKP